tara:strand:+ start:13928 stop:14554 length:627 start_codon:yes stop_codon:yes gene_type:complete
MSDQPTILVWIDLETTGLKPVDKHRVLEYAMVLTDLELNEIASTDCIIPQDTSVATALMDDYVTDMHEGNGLLAELRKVESELPVPEYVDSVRVADEIMAEKLDNNLPDGAAAVIAGNTIGFDKGFIEEHMPILASRLHYRQLDVSAYKVAFPEMFGTKTSNAHRAVDDIRASIESHRKMRELIAIATSQTVGAKHLIQPTFDEDDCC